MESDRVTVRWKNSQRRAFCVEGVVIPPTPRGPVSIQVAHSVLRKIESNEQYKFWCAQGWVCRVVSSVDGPVPVPTQPPVAEPEAEQDESQEPPSDQEPTPEASLKGLSVRAARRAIRSCADTELLLSWHLEETRPAVSEDIEKRIKALEGTSE